VGRRLYRLPVDFDFAVGHGELCGPPRLNLA
jgi:hypothetical protein